ncbi:Stp1/IreP family PP2C-type Ser/Thr phosphatase [Microbulbifer harenosus]|uniref:Stp1/IreP family PP2C-type Ser/Thr phosphatase n=1 Tax=Microbulbifer harenosus TaxID=2576840 RepID=A0ABY2ULB2_9GAMM|nr:MULTISPECIES: Stp1/IreP family PP2C-type Ser/Thr phosphatase [Microbulbifer]QIL90447.1 Stp1/IreP family PP2C-type Ser/Thr phosphatase [Microbulbifer sp. SH-1]TLM77960.1 Stp1/IreP family PP2C-type Ser/Thr phosphatase [Microbulbifer harenosus]
MEPIRLAVNGRTDIGQVREENEDSIRCHSDPNHPFAYVVVADGMGGYSGGAIASAIAADTLQSQLNGLLNATFLACSPQQQQLMLRAALVEAIGMANRKILDTKQTRPHFSQMGTTLVAAVIWQDFLIVAHIGDSRAYLWNNYGLQRLTRDHSVVQEMIDSGQLTPEQAQSSQVRNHITRALGVAERVEATVNSWTLTESALLLLCSDGLTEYLNDHTIERVLATYRPALECVYHFIEDANQCGGRDNISAGIIEYCSRSDAVAEFSGDPITLKPKIKEDITVRKMQR